MKIKAFTILACGLLFASCGSKSEEKTDESVSAIEETAITVDTAEIAEPETAVAEETTATEEPAKDSAKWDELLDEYENYCNKTIEFAKKAKSGDMSAMTEYASLVESASKLQEELNDAKNDLTPAQAARLSKIASKFATAAASM